MKKKLKGKDTFTLAEVNELRRLIRLRIVSPPAEQKGIRDKMRKIGFYGRDDFGIYDLQPEDFEMLIETGRIRIVG